MTHVGREQVGVDDNCGGRDHVINSTDTAVASSVTTGKPSGDAGDFLGYCGPTQGRAEFFERIELFVAYACMELESD